MKKVLALLLVCAMVLGMAACGNTAAPAEPTEPAAETEPQEKVYEIAYLTPSMDISFWRFMSTGIANEAEKLGNVNVTTYDSKSSADIQYTNAQDVIARGVDGIVLTPTDSASAVAVLSLAEEAGIPVAISDIGADGAKEGGAYLATLLAEGDKVAQINGPLARQNQQDRKNGFEEGVMAANVDLVDFRQMELENRDEGESYTQDYLTAYPDLKAIFCTSGEAAMGVLTACQNAGRDDVLILGFDMNEELLEAIRSGAITGACAQQPLLMGAKALDGVVDFLEGKTVEKVQEINTLLITKDNLAETEDLMRETAMVAE